MQKFLCKLSKTIKQAKKISKVFGGDKALYSETKKSEFFFNKKIKISKGLLCQYLYC